MQHTQLPITVNIYEGVEITIHEITWYLEDLDVVDEFDEVGEMKITDHKTNKLETYTIWNGDDKNAHYVCLQIHEEPEDDDEEEELEVFLVSDLLS